MSTHTKKHNKGQGLEKSYSWYVVLQEISHYFNVENIIQEDLEKVLLTTLAHTHTHKKLAQVVQLININVFCSFGILLPFESLKVHLMQFT